MKQVPLRQPSVRNHLSLTRSDDVKSVERIVMEGRGRMGYQNSRRDSKTMLNALTLRHTRTRRHMHTHRHKRTNGTS
jgi:hypothetical protein